MDLWHASLSVQGRANIVYLLREVYRRHGLTYSGYWRRLYRTSVCNLPDLPVDHSWGPSPQSYRWSTLPPSWVNQCDGVPSL